MLDFIIGLVVGSLVGFTVFAVISVGKDGHE